MLRANKILKLFTKNIPIFLSVSSQLET